MGNTIWVDVQGRDPQDLPSDQSLLLRAETELALLSAHLGVPSLSTFYDYSGLGDFDEDFDTDDFDEDGEADDGGDDPADGEDTESSDAAWFDAAPALEAVTRLRQHLAEHQNDAADWKRLSLKVKAGRCPWPDGLLDELAEAQAILADALARKRRFRFLIVS